MEKTKRRKRNKSVVFFLIETLKTVALKWSIAEHPGGFLAPVCEIRSSKLDTSESLHLRKLVFYFWKETNYKALPLGEKNPS